jgi:cyclopropane fatty-acyl-phospholipid synthase-like methyltransferase
MGIFLIFFSVSFLMIIFVVIPLVFFVKIFGYMYTYFFWGAIYVPTEKERVKKMVEFLEIKPSQAVVDLGAGDGRLLIALAKAGAKAYGYEVDPFLVTSARKNIKQAGLEGKAFIYCKNLWSQDLNNFDAVVVFGMRHMMKRLEKKFERELKPGAKIVSNYFTLPTWRPSREEDKIYLYIKK